MHQLIFNPDKPMVSINIPVKQHTQRQPILAWARPALLALALLSFPANAMAQTITTIRDAEIEAVLQSYIQPLFRAAKIQQTKAHITMLSDRRFNAFVDERGHIIINVGAIIQSESPSELIGVLAHEVGHIAGGHVARLKEQIQNQQNLQIVTALLGVGALAVAARSKKNSRGMGQAAAGLIVGSQALGVQTILAYRRSEESTADAAALKLLDATNQSAKGLISVFERFDKNTPAIASLNPYLLSHPLPRDRIEQVTRKAKKSSSWNKKSSKNEILRFELMKAKLIGYLEPRETTLAYYPNSDTSIPAIYARTLALYKVGASISALPQVDRLIKAMPKFAYFHELKGQMLFELGSPLQAIDSLKRATSLAPKEGQIRALYARALIESGDTANIKKAVIELSGLTQLDRRYASPFTLLARGYALLGDIGQAELASAEAALVRGDEKTAKQFANRAQKKLNKESPAAQRARDIFAL